MEFIRNSATAAAALRTGEGSSALAEITRLFLELGLKVDYQAMDWGTLSARARSTTGVRAGWTAIASAGPGWVLRFPAATSRWPG